MLSRQIGIHGIKAVEAALVEANALKRGLQLSRISTCANPSNCLFYNNSVITNSQRSISFNTAILSITSEHCNSSNFNSLIKVALKNSCMNTSSLSSSSSKAHHKSNVTSNSTVKGSNNSNASSNIITSKAHPGKMKRYSKLGMDGFTDVKFNAAADAMLEHIESVIDELNSDEVEEVAASGGVLTLETRNHGTFLINKQAPNIQLWLSSPLSGPHHYDMMVKEKADHTTNPETCATSSSGSNISSNAHNKNKVHAPTPKQLLREVHWLSDHDGHSLLNKLEQELSDVLEVTVKL